MPDDPLIAELVRVLPYSTIPTEDDARAVLDFIAETRRLLPAAGAVVVATTEAAEGFTERVEWGSLEHGEVVTWGIGGEKQARANAKWLRETDPDAKVMRRYIYIGPWEVASE